MTENRATYVCDACGGEFNKGWSDEEAHAEAVENFGRDGHAEDMAIVCDDCFQRMTDEQPLPTTRRKG
jgi:hypothetical protein